MLTCKFRKKILSHILLYVFCLYSLRMHHDYLFRRSFESVRPQFFSGKLGLERTGAEGAPAPSSPPPLPQQFLEQKIEKHKIFICE